MRGDVIPSVHLVVADEESRLQVAVVLWLAAVSVGSALAITVVLLDRTTLSGISRLWLGSLAFWLAAVFAWWTRPKIVGGRVCLSSYKPALLLVVTVPVALLSIGLVSASYLSDGIHSYLFSNFSCMRLLSHRSWPVLPLAWGIVIYSVVWIGRGLAEIRTGAPTASSLLGVPDLSLLLPVAILAIGSLLSVASLSMINVNFWRYWATADGWITIGHYPSTFTDAVQVRGGVAPYFISFPLLPGMLVSSFEIVGHNTLGSYLPLIVGSALLPLVVFLLVRGVTNNPLLAFLAACLVGSFPLFRNYTLDVGEADGLLMTTVVLAAYLRVKADKVGGAVRWQVAAGLAAGAAALARPEGILYMAAMYAADLMMRWRERGFWLSSVVFGAVAACFSAVTLREFGMIWPGNHSDTLSLANFTKTLDVVRQNHLFSMYASALNLSESVLALFVGLALTMVAVGTIQMVRRDFSLIYLPVTALGNVVMVFFVGPIPAEATKFHDFFRHISYGFPLLAVTAAYGVNYLCAHCRRPGLKSIVYGVIALLVVLQLSMLAGPVTPGRPNTTPLMTSDVHVMATELLIDPYPLPVMRFRQSDSRYVPDAADYMAHFPDNVDQHYAGADVRRVGNAIDYFRAATILFVWFLAIVALHFLLINMEQY